MALVFSRPSVERVVFAALCSALVTAIERRHDWISARGGSFGWISFCKTMKVCLIADRKSFALKAMGHTRDQQS